VIDSGDAFVSPDSSDAISPPGRVRETPEIAPEGFQEASPLFSQIDISVTAASDSTLRASAAIRWSPEI
jgi:hypothetical protein